MSAELSVNNGDTSPAVIGSADPSASQAGQESGSGASAQIADGVTVAQSTQDNSGNVNGQASSAAPAQEIDPLEGVPSLEELSQNQSQPYAKALVQLRTAYEASKLKVSEYEPLAPFRDVVQNSTPEQLKAKLDIVDGLFSSAKDAEGKIQYKDGMPIPDATEGVSRLVAGSPDTAYAVFNALRNAQVDGSSLGEQFLTHCFKQWGLNPENIQQYAQWERDGGAPVANSAVDLSKIPQEYQAVVKQLPARVQADYASLSQSENAEDQELLKHYLDRDRRDYDAQTAQANARQQAERDTQANVERNTETAIQGKMETGVNQFLEHLSTWKPTADDAVNKAYHLETASSLINLLDPRMGTLNNMLYQTIGMQPDAEIPSLNAQFQQQMGLSEHYKARGDSFRAAEAQRSADSAYMRLVAKLNGVAGKLIEHKSKVAANAAAAEAASGQNGRGYVQGQSAAQAASGGRNGNWTKAWYD